MNNKAVAKELVKLANRLVAAPVVDLPTDVSSFPKFKSFDQVLERLPALVQFVKSTKARPTEQSWYHGVSPAVSKSNRAAQKDLLAAANAFVAAVNRYMK